MHPLFHYAEIRIKSSGRLIHIRKRLFHDKERTFYRFCCLYFSGDAVLPGYHRHFQRIPAARRYLGKYYLIPPDFRIALAPLCEIMRQRRHPVTGQTMEEMYKALRPNEN